MDIIQQKKHKQFNKEKVNEREIQQTNKVLNLSDGSFFFYFISLKLNYEKEKKNFKFVRKYKYK